MKIINSSPNSAALTGTNLTNLILAASIRKIRVVVARAGGAVLFGALALCLSGRAAPPTVTAIADPATQPTNADSAVDAAAIAPPSPTDVELARAAMDKGDTRVAIEYASRELDRAPGNAETLELFTKCVRQEASVDRDQANFGAAESRLSQLRDRLRASREARTQPGVTVGLDDIAARQQDLQTICDAMMAAADAQADPHIAAAMKGAGEAHYHWYTCWPNDRDKVRDGLRELRWVYDHGAPLSPDEKGKYQQALDWLKSLVSDSEWQPLLAEAGFAAKENPQ